MESTSGDLRHATYLAFTALALYLLAGQDSAIIIGSGCSDGESSKDGEEGGGGELHVVDLIECVEASSKCQLHVSIVLGVWEWSITSVWRK